MEEQQKLTNEEKQKIEEEERERERVKKKIKEEEETEIKKEEDAKKKKKDREGKILVALFIGTLIVFWIGANFLTGLVVAIIVSAIWKNKERIPKGKKERIMVGFLCLVCIFTFVFILSFSGNGEPKQERVLTEAEQREKTIEAQFSAWDGSHRKLTEIIKKSMNDPKSYEHVETRYWDMGDHLIINTTFRGKNVFGGTVVNTIKAKVSFDGESVEILEQF